jgi:hypothetical protein
MCAANETKGDGKGNKEKEQCITATACEERKRRWHPSEKGVQAEREEKSPGKHDMRGRGGGSKMATEEGEGRGLKSQTMPRHHSLIHSPQGRRAPCTVSSTLAPNPSTKKKLALYLSLHSLHPFCFLSAVSSTRICVCVCETQTPRSDCVRREIKGGRETRGSQTTKSVKHSLKKKRESQSVSFAATQWNMEYPAEKRKQQIDRSAYEAQVVQLKARQLITKKHRTTTNAIIIIFIIVVAPRCVCVCAEFLCLKKIGKGQGILGRCDLPAVRATHHQRRRRGSNAHVAPWGGAQIQVRLVRYHVTTLQQRRWV